MKTTRRQIMLKMLPITAIVFTHILCIGTTDTAYAQQTTANIAITVTSTKQQTFDGFGSAMLGINFIPAGGRKGIPGSVSAQVYDRLFKTNDANSLNLTFVRLGVPTSNYKNTATASYDFNTAIEKTGQGDIIRAARARNSKLRVFFSAWTPPYWMKRNNKEYNVGTPGSDDKVTVEPDAPTTNRLKPEEYGNYATLLKTFCDDFRTKFGFYPHALSLQNEPDLNVSYGSCLYTVDEYKNALTAVRKAFGLSYPTKLWGPELGGSAGARVNYVKTIAGTGLLDAIAQHSYNGDISLIPDSAKNNLKVIQTEYAPLEQSPPVYKGDQQLIAATEINQFCKDANKGKVSSWIHWEAIGIKFPGGGKDIGESLISAEAVSNPNTVYKYVDQQGVSTQGVWNLNDNEKYPADGAQYSPQWNLEFQNFQLTSLYYAFRRLTQSVTPGSVSRLTNITPSRDQGSDSQKDVYAAGFKRSDGKYCLVVANSGSTAYQGALKFDELAKSGRKGFNTYYTSGDEKGPINDATSITKFNNGEATATLNPRAVYIFVQQ